MTVDVDGGGWGAADWGASPWGTGEPELALLSAFAVRENCVRFEFSAPPILDGLLTPHDASDPRRFSIVPVSGIALDGEEVRPVSTVLVEVAPVPGGGGRFLDVWLDRPMTGYPAVYRASANGLVSSGGSILAPGSSATFLGVRAGHAAPTPEHSVASRDLLIAQSARDLVGANVVGDPEKLLGTLPVAASGDYASATPLASYRMRVLRRATATLASFAHLPKNYGTTIASSVKKPFRGPQAEDVAAQIEAQVRLEPETTGVSVTVSSDGSGVVVYKLLARSRIGEVELTFSG